MTFTYLRTLVLAVWSLIHPAAPTSGDAPQIADAIAQAVLEDYGRGYADAPLEAATLAVYAWAESRLRREPAPVSWDARAAVSCGWLQEPCAFAAHASDLDQARWWLATLHAGGLAALDSSATRAGRRMARAAALLTAVHHEL